MATAKLIRKPRLSKFEFYKAAITNRDIVSPQVLCRFVHIETHPAAAATRRVFWADMSTLLGAWVLVNAKTLGPQEGS